MATAGMVITICWSITLARGPARARQRRLRRRLRTAASGIPAGQPCARARLGVRHTRSFACLATSSLALRSLDVYLHAYLVMSHRGADPTVRIGRGIAPSRWRRRRGRQLRRRGAPPRRRPAAAPPPPPASLSRRRLQHVEREAVTPGAHVALRARRGASATACCRGGPRPAFGPSPQPAKVCKLALDGFATSLSDATSSPRRPETPAGARLTDS